jgi:hypothetical protein
VNIFRGNIGAIVILTMMVVGCGNPKPITTKVCSLLQVRRVSEVLQHGEFLGSSGQERITYWTFVSKEKDGTIHFKSVSDDSMNPFVIIEDVPLGAQPYVERSEDAVYCTARLHTPSGTALKGVYP